MRYLAPSVMLAILAFAPAALAQDSGCNDLRVAYEKARNEGVRDDAAAMVELENRLEQLDFDINERHKWLVRNNKGPDGKDARMQELWRQGGKIRAQQQRLKNDRVDALHRADALSKTYQAKKCDTNQLPGMPPLSSHPWQPGYVPPPSIPGRRVHPPWDQRDLAAERERLHPTPPRPPRVDPWQRTLNTLKPWERLPVPSRREPETMFQKPLDKVPSLVEPAPAYQAPTPLVPITSQYSAWMTGRFKTDFGVMTLSPGGGSYDYYGGRLSVESVDGATMVGRWTQTQGGGQCADGTHAGPFSFTFTATGFTGSWSRCDGSGGGSWSGTRE